MSRSLELLENLKKTGAAFARREEQLSRDLGARRFAINRAHHEAITAHEGHFSTQAATVTSHFKAAEEKASAVYENRKERIERFYNENIRDLPQRARQAKESWMGNLQMHDFQAQTQRTDDLKEAEEVCVKSLDTLSLVRGDLAKLEKLTQYTFLPWRLRKILRAPIVPQLAPTLADASALLTELQAHLDTIHEELRPFRQFRQPFLIRFLYLFAASVCISLLSFPLGWPVPVGVMAVFALFLFCPYPLSKKYWKFLETHTERVVHARQLSADCETAIHAAYQTHALAINQTYEQIRAEIAKQWNRADSIEDDFSATAQASLESRTPRATAKNEEMFHQKLFLIATERDAQLTAIQCDEEAQKAQLTANHETEMAQWTAESSQSWEKLQADWKRQITPLYQTLEAMNATASAWFPAWTPALADAWTPPTAVLPATQFGRIEADLTAHPEGLPKDPRLALPGSPKITLPLALAVPSESSLLFETTGPGDDTVIGTLNQIILRLLTTTPPGKISFTIIDPVGLGENFAGLMQLSD